MQPQTEDQLASEYHSDVPVTEKSDDAFDRWPFVSRICSLISQRQQSPSLSIGIYGAWGEGKTTVLRFLIKELQTNSDVTVVTFNPWRIGNEEQLILSFLSALARALDTPLKKKSENAAALFGDYAAGLMPFSILTGKGAPIAKSAGKLLEHGLKKWSEVGLEELKNRLEKALITEKRRIAVIIDDLDRMPRNEISLLFRLVKACADFPYVVYVLAFDDRVVASSLADAYGSGESKSGYDFLEKIIQVPLRLPTASTTSLVSFCYKEIERAVSSAGIVLSEADVHAFVTAFTEGITPALKTPRMAKRYANALSFALPMLKGEVHPVDQLLIEALRVFYPAIYDVVRNDTETFLRRSEYEKREAKQREIRKAIEPAPTDLQPAVLELLMHLFPEVGGAFSNTSYSTESVLQWEREKRVCARPYFQRYFNYTIPTGDIADSSIVGLMLAANANEQAILNSAIERLLSEKTAEIFISKIDGATNLLTAAGGATLALKLASAADRFPQNVGIFSFSTFSKSAHLLSRLVALTPKGKDRDSLAGDVIAASQPVEFAAEFFSWLRRGSNPENSLLSKNGEKTVPRTLVTRIRQEPDAIFSRDGRFHYRLFELWRRFGSAKECRTFLRKWISSNPNNVMLLLKSMVGTAQSLSGGRCRPGDFEGDTYKVLAQFVDPKAVMRILKKHFGNKLKSDSHYFDPDTPDDERIACQFAYVHKHANLKKAESNNLDQQSNT